MDSILFPNIGIIAATPGIIVLLLILNIAVVVVSAIVKPNKELVDSAAVNRDFEYSNDIFNGCPNGTLTLSLAKNPDVYNEETDRPLRVCINYEDIEAIEDAAVSGRLKYDDSATPEQRQKTIEENKKTYEKFASAYPFVARIKDMYEDYDFAPEEVVKLREECLNLRARKPSAEAERALRKLIYACDEALKDNYHLKFICD